MTIEEINEMKADPMRWGFLSPREREIIDFLLAEVKRLKDEEQKMLEVWVHSGIEMIFAERMRQIWDEGFPEDHDDQWTKGQLSIAGAIYAFPPTSIRDKIANDFWPFANSWWKPTPTNRIKELIKAGALITAEIDRLMRLMFIEVKYPVTRVKGR